MTVVETLVAYRAALAAGDTERCLALTAPDGAARAEITAADLADHPLLRRAGEQASVGLRAAASSYHTAAAARWWQGARSTVGHTRMVAPDLVEVYEDVSHVDGGRWEFA